MTNHTSKAGFHRTCGTIPTVFLMIVKDLAKLSTTLSWLQ